jgi:hypothetical protein
VSAAGNYSVIVSNGSCSASSASVAVQVFSATTNFITLSTCSSFTLNGQSYSNSGTYTQVISNSAGCDSIITLNLTINQPPSVSLFSSDVTTAGGSDGSINLIVNASSTVLSYSWSNGATSEDINGLSAGTYIVTITDLNGCYIIESATINQPPSSIITSQNDWIANIYPNPAEVQTMVDIRISNYDTVRIRLVNVLGQILENSTYEGILKINHIFDISELPAGTYFVEITVGSSTKTLNLNVIKN